MAALAKSQDAEKVVFVGINSNVQDNITKVKHFARSHGIEFPMLMDVDQKLADQWEVKRVPEVIVLGTDGKLRYRGRVDDQHGFQVGPEGKRAAYHLPEPRRADLKLALEEILAGKEVSVAATEAPGCLIGRARSAKGDAAVTYSSHIAAIFNKHCVFCHREGQIGPFPMTSHDLVAGWSEMIQEVVQERRMPPWHADPKHGKFKNDARLSEEEIALISQWVADGAPAGDLAKAPSIPEFPEGWMIPEPDQVVYMAKEPYTVQAEGTVPYKNFIVDPGWTEDKWVTAMEPKPGNPKVVHHIVMYVIPPKGKSKYYTKGLPITMLDWFVSFAPGLRPPVLPEYMGRYIPAGSKLLFQMHYTPCGTEEKDLSYVGVKFADPAKIKREVAVQHAGNMLSGFRPMPKTSGSIRPISSSVIRCYSPSRHTCIGVVRFQIHPYVSRRQGRGNPQRPPLRFRLANYVHPRRAEEGSERITPRLRCPLRQLDRQSQ
ncbi:MAG: redoxin domain-containing protein [Planctomycetota bacterium]